MDEGISQEAGCKRGNESYDYDEGVTEIAKEWPMQVNSVLSHCFCDPYRTSWNMVKDSIKVSSVSCRSDIRNARMVNWKRKYWVLFQKHDWYSNRGILDNSSTFL